MGDADAQRRDARDRELGELMRRAQGGDGVAYDELLTAVRVILTVYVRSASRRLHRDDPAVTDDVVQEALLALHRKRHTYDPAQPFMPWALAIARYKVIDAWRARRRRPADPTEASELEAVAAEGSPAADDAVARTDVEQLLAQLPERTRRLVELVKLEGFSVAEAAAATQMSESAVKVAVHRALKTLRARFTGKEAT
jgi:RNA polymerase sigma-70 factor (ECF subfamily)